MKKNDKLVIKISTEDKNKLKYRAEQSGLSLSSYCIWILLNTVPKTEFIEK